MSEALLDIKHWGNNLGVRLPAAVAREAHLHADQRVRVSVEDGRVVITPLEVAPPTLEQRLARFDPTRHGGEAMAGECEGGVRSARRKVRAARGRAPAPDSCGNHLEVAEEAGAAGLACELDEDVEAGGG